MRPASFTLPFLLLVASPTLHAQSANPNSNRDALSTASDGFAIDEQNSRLVLTHAGKAVAEFVFADDKIRRPYFANVHAPGGLKVTRNHPPVAGTDAVDHDTMHPGIWLGFGAVNGEDFWRNKGRIEHLRFAEPPAVRGDEIRFTEESRFLTAGEKSFAGLVSRVRLARRSEGWLITWDAEIRATESDLVFGDQEEMGLGVRVATGLTEKAGGRVANSAGQSGANETWGKQSAWCDYSGKLDGQQAGVSIFPDVRNPRACWWHNRDYGVFVANPFGKRAGLPNGALTVKQGDSLRLRFHVLLHAGAAPPDLPVIAKELTRRPLEGP